MTGTELIQAVRDLLGEDTPAAFTDALILRFVNNSYRELYSEVVENNELHFGTTGTLNYTANTERITLPTNSRIIRVEFTTALGIPLDRKATFIDLVQRDEFLQQIGNSIVSEDERKVYLFGNAIGVLPVPTSSVSAALRVYYVPPATALVAGTSPPLEWSTDHHEVIAWGAFMRTIVRDKEMLAENRPTFARLRLLLLNATAKRESQEPKQIVMTYGE